MQVSSKRKIVHLRNGILTEKEDEIVNELHLKLAINFKKLSSLMCSPADIEDLTAGYLVTSGILTPENNLLKLEYEPNKNIMHIELENNEIIKDLIFSVLKPVGCGAGDLLFVKHTQKIEALPDVTLNSDFISQIMLEFNKSSELFKETGGVHSAAICDQNGIITVREDIGRHNAVDKVIGSVYRSGGVISDKVVLTSGRISSEIVMKLINARVQVLISRSAPTSGAVELAELNGLTLIGFARATNFNVYCDFERIKFV